MNRRTLAFALAAVLAPAAAQATDLLQTYEMARAGDPQLAIAESSRLIQKEGAVQARANLLPSLDGSVTLGRSHTAGRDGRSSSRGYDVSLSQSVFDWGAISNLRAERAISEGADYNLEAAGDDLIVRTSAAYFNVLVAIESLAAAQAAETALQKQFDYASKRLEVGLAPITDVHEARAQYDSARANTILARNVLHDAYEALAELTGQPVANLKGLPDDFRPQLPTTGDADTWVATALERNPSLRATEYSLRAALHDVSTARAGHYPTLSLGAGYGNDARWGDPGVGTGLATDSEGYNYGLTLRVPIFSGGATQSRVRTAIAQRDIAEDQLEQQKRALVRNTRDAYQNLVAGISEIEARRLALVSAQSAYEASQVGLEVGTRTVLDVLQNQRTLLAAQQEYAVAKYSYLQNRLLLEQAAGTLDIAHVQEVNRLLTKDAEAELTDPAPATETPDVR